MGLAMLPWLASGNVVHDGVGVHLQCAFIRQSGEDCMQYLVAVINASGVEGYWFVAFVLAVNRACAVPYQSVWPFAVLGLRDFFH